MKHTLALSIAVAALLMGGSLSLPGAGNAVAQSCSPSSAPRPVDGRVSGAWWGRYSKWCSECGGNPYQDSSGGGCRPGPNWGGKAGGGAASSGDAATDAGRIAADMFSRLNPQTNAQAVTALGASVLTGVLSASIAEMMKGPSPEQIRQRQIQEELARQEEARRARERAEAERQAHLRVMGMLKGTSTWDGQMALKTDGDAGSLQIKAGDNYLGGSASTLGLKTGESADPHFQQQQQDLSRALSLANLHADMISDGEREKALSNLIMGKGFELADVKMPQGVPVRSEDVSQFALHRQKFMDAFERVEAAKEKMEKAGNDKEQIAQARKALDESIKDMKKMLPPEQQQQQQAAPPPKPDKKAEEEDEKLKQANKLFDESSQMDAKADKALEDAKKGYADSEKEWQNVRRDTFEFLNRLAKNGETTNASAAK